MRAALLCLSLVLLLCSAVRGKSVVRHVPDCPDRPPLALLDCSAPLINECFSDAACVRLKGHGYSCCKYCGNICRRITYG